MFYASGMLRVLVLAFQQIDVMNKVLGKNSIFNRKSINSTFAICILSYIWRPPANVLFSSRHGCHRKYKHKTIKEIKFLLLLLVDDIDVYWTLVGGKFPWVAKRLNTSKFPSNSRWHPDACADGGRLLAHAQKGGRSGQHGKLPVWCEARYCV